MFYFSLVAVKTLAAGKVAESNVVVLAATKAYIARNSVNVALKRHDARIRILLGTVEPVPLMKTRVKMHLNGTRSPYMKQNSILRWVDS